MTPGAPGPDASVDSTLDLYLAELYRWNLRVNLTAIPRARAERRHLEETRLLLTTAGPPCGARVADIGSGGGVPGLVLAILRPDLRVTLIESDRRAAGFLVHAAALCGCSGVTVVPRRAEEVGRDPEHRAAHDLVVSRAAAPPAVLCELALPLLRVGRRLLALVSDAAAAAESARTAAAACGGGPPAVAAPGILEVTKLVPTPDRYPRRPGVPGRRPLAPPPPLPGEARRRPPHHPG
jgi:16S rRNA (guanine527-N7)-methyltransferase